MKYEWMTVRVANCADRSFSTARAGSIARRALNTEGDFGLPDVVLFCEVSDVDLRLPVELAGYDLVQFGRTGAPQAGVAIANRLETTMRLGSSHIIEGSAATEEGGGIRTRVAVSDRYRLKHTKSLRLWAGHAPPQRSPIARALYLAAIKGLRGAVGMDANMPVLVMRATSVRRWRGHGVLGLLIPNRFKSTPAHTVDIGSDHLAVDVQIRLPLRKAFR